MPAIHVFLLLQNVFSLPKAHAVQARADARPLQHALEHIVFLLLQNVFSLSLLLAQGALKALADAPPPPAPLHAPPPTP